MPRLEVLPANPSFGSQLGSALGGGLGQGLNQGIAQYFEQKERKSQLAGLAPLFEQAGIGEDDFQKVIQSGIPIEHAINALKVTADLNKKKQDDSLQDQDYEKILDQMDDMLKSGEAGIGAHLKSYLPWGGSERESTAQFQSSGTALLGLAQKVALKQGIRNQREFQVFLARTVPNASDTVSTARGKIKALRGYLKSDESAKNTDSQRDDSQQQEEEFIEMIDPSGKKRKVPRSLALQAQKNGAKVSR